MKRLFGIIVAFSLSIILLSFVSAEKKDKKIAQTATAVTARPYDVVMEEIDGIIGKNYVELRDHPELRTLFEEAAIAYDEAMKKGGPSTIMIKTFCRKCTATCNGFHWYSSCGSSTLIGCDWFDACPFCGSFFCLSASFYACYGNCSEF